MTKTFTLLVLLLSVAVSLKAQQAVTKVFYHNYDNTQLTLKSQKQLNEWIEQVKQLSPVAVSIKSFADKNGLSDYNQQLSEQRSLYLLKILQANLPGNILYTTNHYGEDGLVTDDDNEQAKNRRSVLIITFKKEELSALPEKPETPDIELTPYSEDVKEQRFIINLDDTVFIKGKDGTVIQFAPGTIESKNGNMATGKATLLLKEYYQPGDILLFGTRSESSAGLLQTSGMFKISIVQNGDTMAKETMKPVYIKIPDLNGISAKMNVFTMSHGDTLWKDTKQMFSYSKGFWDWPSAVDKLKDFYVDHELPYRRWQTGRRWTEEYYVSKPLFDFMKRFSNRTLTKDIRYTLTKKDAETLTVSLSEKFRKGGVKKFYGKSFDTTFDVDYVLPYYETSLSNLSYINCDRFVDAPVRTDIFVKTPGFKGTSLLVYFSRLNAFMNVAYSKGKYTVRNVPPNEKVILIAIGKMDEECYYGKQEFTTSKNATTLLQVKPVKYEEMKKLLAEIAYTK